MLRLVKQSIVLAVHGCLVAFVCLSLSGSESAYGQMTRVGRCWANAYGATGPTGSWKDDTALTDSYKVIGNVGSFPGCYALALEYAKTFPATYKEKCVYVVWVFGQWGKITQFSKPSPAAMGDQRVCPNK